MSLLQIGAAVAAGALLVGTLSFLVTRSRLPWWEGLLQSAAISGALLLIGLLLALPTEPGAPQAPPALFCLVAESLFAADPGAVATEVGRARQVSGRSVGVATYRDGEQSREWTAAPASGNLPRTERRFSSLATAIGWAELEGAGRSGAILVLAGDGAKPEAAAQIPLLPVAIPAGGAPPVVVSFEAPRFTPAGRKAAATALLGQSGAQPRLLRLLLDGSLVEARTISAAAQPNAGNPAPPPREETFSFTPSRPGIFPLALEVFDGRDRFLERSVVELDVRNRPLLHHVREPGLLSPLGAYLQRHGYAVRGWSDLAQAAQAARGGEVLLLEDLPAGRFSWPVVSELVRAASLRGTGILVAGGERSFGPGGYGGNPVERLLPLWMGIRNPDQEKHTTALIVILDTSLSMFCYPEGCASDAERMYGGGRAALGPRVRKIDLARQALLNLLAAMKPADTFGLLGAKEAPYWEAEPAPLLERAVIEERVRRITASGGGINLYSSLIQAFDAAVKIDAEVRHVLVLLDTDDIDETRILGGGTVESLVRGFEKARVSLSVVGFGFSGDRFVPLLNRLTAETGGYLYLTSDVERIPSFLIEDREKLSRQQVIRRPLRVSVDLRQLPGITEAPPLEGQFITEAKADARVLLWTELGYPVFAERRLGRGRVGALAIDGGRTLAPAWVRDGALPVWDAVLGSLQGRQPGPEQVFVSRGVAGWQFVYRAAPGAAAGPPTGLLLGPTLPLPRPVPLRESEPLLYEGSAGVLGPGTYRFTVTVPGRERPAAESVFAVPPPPPAAAVASRNYGSLKPAAPPAAAPWGGRGFRLLLLAASALFLAAEFLRPR